VVGGRCGIVIGIDVIFSPRLRLLPSRLSVD